MRGFLFFLLGFSWELSLPIPSEASVKTDFISTKVRSSRFLKAGCYQPFVASPSLAAKLALAKSVCGDVIFISQHRGIIAYTHDLRPIATVSSTSGRFLRLDPSKRYLYFFTHTELRRVDLSTGQEVTTASIPKLEHQIFYSQHSQGINPVDFIQREGEVSFDFRKGYVCFNIMDRNENMASGEVNYRIQLESGKVEFSVVAETTEEDRRRSSVLRLCDVDTKEKWIADATSPLGQWKVGLEPILPGGDYIHHRLSIFQSKAEIKYAVLPLGLVKVHRSLSKSLEEKACSIVSEDHVEWLHHHDTLLIQSCQEEEFQNFNTEPEGEPNEGPVITVVDMKTHIVTHLSGQAFLLD